ncbi:AAA family ATPase [Halosimplex rubrum]|uniref:AAA family ATPase n=1 Tax=Halosimplex rubrum TaxID=869889 RepID=A0A7D5PB99_9EURY|nr:AAA family ATPase [Halosimplex rubrum]QLH78199.1 AAA family ATPase [Halosimplex rubrum]
MITDARALRPEFVPGDLHHREGQIDHLSSVLAPIQFDHAENITIFGPNGAGKTTIAKYVLSQLERESLGIRWGYVDCMADNTTATALHTLVRDRNLSDHLRRREPRTG